MNSYFVQVHRTSEDPFNYPHLGKVQYFKIELVYHGFNILPHPDYPGNFRARFIALHNKPSMVSYINLRYSDIQHQFTLLNNSAHSVNSPDGQYGQFAQS
jgi:hypothetical protein